MFTLYAGIALARLNVLGCTYQTIAVHAKHAAATTPPICANLREPEQNIKIEVAIAVAAKIKAARFPWERSVPNSIGKPKVMSAKKAAMR